MTDSLMKLILKLFFNGLRFQYLKRTGGPGRPQAISLEITHHCIAKCIMCNIWKIPGEVKDLSMDHWIHLLSSDFLSDLRELDITGGEPFLRKDLPELFSGICRLKQKNLKPLQSIAVTTNGFLTGRVLDCLQKSLPKLRDRNIELVMVCAMDAIGNVHDRVRNYPDGWLQVNETIQGLEKLREAFSNLIIGIKSTILPINVKALQEIALYAEKKGLFTIISPCIITDGRYLNPDRAHDLVFTQEDIKELIKFYESEASLWSYHGETVVRFFKEGMTKKPCSCGFNYFFIRSTGELFLCPLVNLSMGNIIERPIEDLFRSKKASKFRRTIGKFPQCRRCTEPGLERYALPYEGFSYLSLLLKKGGNEFLQLHQHMGLDKYFP